MPNIILFLSNAPIHEAEERLLNIARGNSAQAKEAEIERLEKTIETYLAVIEYLQADGSTLVKKPDFDEPDELIEFFKFVEIKVELKVTMAIGLTEERVGRALTDLIMMNA